MTPTAYFWREGQLVEYFGDTLVNTVARAGLSDLYAVDLTTTLPMERFGIYEARSAWRQLPFAWRHVPLDKFPPEFRTALLLLGIT